MSEDVIGKLAGFTPDAGRLNRDELLFQAGRSSAKPGRGWKRAVKVLVVTQLATVAFWALQPEPRPIYVSLPPGPPALPVADYSPSEPPPLDPNSYFALSRGWDDARPTDPIPPPFAGTAIPRRPLTAGWRGDPLQ